MDMIAITFDIAMFLSLSAHSRGTLAPARVSVCSASGGSTLFHSGVNSFQCPSETTSTVPSVTLMAVSSSIAMDARVLDARCLPFRIDSGIPEYSTHVRQAHLM